MNIKALVIKTIKSIWTICLYYVLQFFSFCFFTCILSLVLIDESKFLQAIKEANEMMNNNNNIVYILTSCSAIFMLFMFFGKARVEFLQNLKPHKLVFRKAFWVICLGMAASFLINIVINILLQTDHNQMIESESSINGLLYCIGIIVVAPVVEETIYRELIFRDLIKVTSLPFAIVTSSFLFAVVHGNLIQFIYTFCMGGMFAFLLYVEDSVLYSIMAHVGFNFIACTLYFINEISILWAIVGGIFSIVLFMLSVKQVILLNRNGLIKRGETRELLS